jgi:hypothetical protein
MTISYKWSAESSCIEICICRSHQVAIHLETQRLMKIPTTQVAAWLEKPHPEATLLIRNDIEVPQPRTGEILVNLLYTGFW